MSSVFRCLAIAFAHIPGWLAGQEKLMDTVVVTSSLSVQHERETGRNVVSISGTALSKLPVATVDDALRYLPGIEVQQRGPAGSQADFIIRGGTFQQVLVLIDGVRINDPLTGHFNGYIPIPLAEIERIEVLKGVASSIHGSDAVGGVINIITKTGNHSAQAKKHRIQAGVEAGELGLFNTQAWWRMRTEKSSLSAGFFSQNATGPRLRGTSGYFHNSAGTVGFSHSFDTDTRLSVRSAFDLRDFNAQNFYTTFLSDTAKERVRSHWHQLNFRRQKGEGVLNIDAAFKALEDRYSFRPVSIPNQNRTRMFISQAFYTFPAGERTRLTAGVQYIHQSIRSNDRGDHSLPHAAAYLIASHRLRGPLHINESLRLEWDGNYGFVLVPQLNLSWTRGRFTLRGSAGKGIRDADFTERYNNFNKTLVTGGRIGNPDLRTERSWSYEAGGDYRIVPWMTASATVFHRSQRDLIDWTPTPYAMMPNQANLIPTGSYALATNLSSVTTTGLEFDLRMEKSLDVKSRILLTNGLLLLDSESDGKTPSFYLSSHARFLLNTSAMWQTGRFALSVTSLYKRRNPQSDAALQATVSRSYWLLNLRARYDVTSAGSHLFVQAHNLGDVSYSDLLGARMPGRWLSAGLQLSF